jgi:hypothetical protein
MESKACKDITETRTFSCTEKLYYREPTRSQRFFNTYVVEEYVDGSVRWDLPILNGEHATNYLIRTEINNNPVQFNSISESAVSTAQILFTEASRIEKHNINTQA